MSKSNKFEGEVITHLQYIRETQTRHESLFNQLFEKLNNQVRSCDSRFDNINKDLDTAKGFAKGAAIMGGIGGFSGFISIISRLFR